MPSPLLPLEPVVTVPVIVDNEETPLELYALEAARSEDGLVANVQAVTPTGGFAKLVRFGIPSTRHAFCDRLLEALHDQNEPLLVPPAEIERALIELQTGVEQALRQQAAQPTKPGAAGGRDATTADQLVKLACDSAQLFLTTQNEPYAHVQITNRTEGQELKAEDNAVFPQPSALSRHHSTLPLRSPEFRDWLTQRFWRSQGKAPHSHALQTALDLLAGLARFQGGPPRPLHVRLARLGVSNTTSPSPQNARMMSEDAMIDLNRQSDSSFILHPSSFRDAIWLDLADPLWQAIRVTPQGWELIPDPPPLFRRSPAMMPLPTPEPGGTLEELRACLNLDADQDWRLLIVWLVAALIPDFPHPILHLHGPQDTGKSSLARMLLDLLDPTAAPLRALPRDHAECARIAQQRWILCLDNLTSLPPWLNALLCQAIEGEALSPRLLPPNLGGRGGATLGRGGEEDAFRSTVILVSKTGLEPNFNLPDKCLQLKLEPIDPMHRRPDRQVRERWQQVRPRVFGALLDLLVGVLRELPNVSLRQPPSLADFAAIGVATERALGWPGGTFMADYSQNLQQQAARTPLIVLLRTFLLSWRVWEGTVHELLKLLQEFLADHDWDEEEMADWRLPAQPNQFARCLRSLQPELERVGCLLTFTRSNHQRLLRCELV